MLDKVAVWIGGNDLRDPAVNHDGGVHRATEAQVFLVRRRKRLTGELDVCSLDREDLGTKIHAIRRRACSVLGVFRRDAVGVDLDRQAARAPAAEQTFGVLWAAGGGDGVAPFDRDLRKLPDGHLEP